MYEWLAKLWRIKENKRLTILFIKYSSSWEYWSLCIYLDKGTTLIEPEGFNLQNREPAYYITMIHTLYSCISITSYYKNDILNFPQFSLVKIWALRIRTTYMLEPSLLHIKKILNNKYCISSMAGSGINKINIHFTFPF